MPTTLDKPAGLPVFPPHAEPEGDCLLKRLVVEQPWRSDVAWPEGFEGGLAHRLDNSTSGAILVADDLEELQHIRECFREHRFTKRYLLLAARDVPWDENVCDKPIAHDPRKRNRMTVQRGRNTPHRGQWYEAQTEFRRYRPPHAGGGPPLYSPRHAGGPSPTTARATFQPDPGHARGYLFEATMSTGVTHQIRVHAAFLGIPILGDKLYGGGPTPPNAPPGLTFFLHHVGLTGPGDLRTTPLPPPTWSIRD